MRPIGVTYSASMEKFWIVLAFRPHYLGHLSKIEAGETYAILSLWINLQHITNIHARLPPPLPLLHLHITQVMRRIHITCLPPASNLFRQFQRLLMFCQFLRGLLAVGMCGIAPSEARRVVAVVWTRALCGAVPEERENASVDGIGSGAALRWASVRGGGVAAGDFEGRCWCWSC